MEQEVTLRTIIYIFPATYMKSCPAAFLPCFVVLFLAQPNTAGRRPEGGKDGITSAECKLAASVSEHMFVSVQHHPGTCDTSLHHMFTTVTHADIPCLIQWDTLYVQSLIYLLDMDGCLLVPTL